MKQISARTFTCSISAIAMILVLTFGHDAAALSRGAAKESSRLISTPASDSRITFVGRTQVQGDKVSFDWSGVYAKVKFEGNYLAIKVSDTNRDYFNIFLDRGMSEVADNVVKVEGKDTVIVIVDEKLLSERYGKTGRGSVKAVNGPHNVIIQKRTEGEQGTSTIEAFITNGQLLQAEGLKPRMLEFIGDSYTCGYGTEGKDLHEHFKPETENVNLTYESTVARYFDADYIVIAHSGMGIARNYGDKSYGYFMGDRYLQTFDSDKDIRWHVDDVQKTQSASMAGFKPSLTVVMLGANDFSTARQPSLGTFIENYHKLLQEIKDNYGTDYPILCLSPRGSVDIFEYVRAAVESCGMKNVYYMGFGDAIFFDDELGSDYHPKYSANRKYAMSVIPYISTLTRWELSR